MRSPLGFSLWVLALSLPFWVAGAVTDLELAPGLPVSSLVALCPLIAAMIVVHRAAGRGGVRALLANAVGRARGRSWFVLATVLMPSLAILALATRSMLEFSRSLELPGIGMASVLLIAFLIAALGEELGWSAYATEAMRPRWGVLRTSLLIGCGWAAWQIPALIQASRELDWIAWHCLGLIAFRVLLGWLYEHSGRSVAVVALCHAMADVAWLFPDSGYSYDPRVHTPITLFAVVVLHAVGPPVRRVERAAAWITVTLAWCALALGLVGPHLGGAAPGLEGPLGYASETVVAMWLQGGALAAVVVGACLLRRLWRPAAVLAPVTLVILVPEVWTRSRTLEARPSAAPALRLVAVNLAEQNTDDPFMADALRRLDADVLVLSEITESWSLRLDDVAADYPHRWLGRPPEFPGRWTQGARLAVWSRVPPAGDAEVVRLAEFTPMVRVPLRWRGRDVAVYGIHPGKPFPYRLYPRTWRQRRELLARLQREDLPMIVAGDFNAPPRSALLQTMRRLGLTSAAESVLGYAPATWPLEPRRLAPLRIAIDHVMHSDSLVATRFELGPPTNSDHAAVVAELSWRQP